MRPQFAEAVNKWADGGFDLYAAEEAQKTLLEQKNRLKKLFLEKADAYEKEMKEKFGKTWNDLNDDQKFQWKQTHAEEFYYSVKLLDNRLAPVADRSSIVLSYQPADNEKDLLKAVPVASSKQIPVYPLQNLPLRSDDLLLLQK
jgi:hypothetical protein